MSNTELHHLLGRAIDGVVLHGESDRLRELVRELEADRERVHERACRLAEHLRKAEARVTELEQVARGYCPHCGRGDAAPGLDDWDRERKRAEQAEAALSEARMWARHGYEIGQRSCTWSDYGVAPAWLTETAALDQPQQPTTASPTAVLLATPCEICEHTLNWHRNDVGCIAERCVCAQFEHPA